MGAIDIVSIVCENCGKPYNLSRKYVRLLENSEDDSLIVNCNHCKRDDVISLSQRSGQ